MAVSNQSNKVTYVATGNNTYPVPFFFTNNSHIKIFINDTPLEYGDDYTVSGANNEAGGTLALLIDPPDSNESVVILRDVPITQDNSLNDGGPNAAVTTERMFDKLTLIGQQINEKAERAIKFPLSSDANPQMEGEVSPGAVLQCNASGTGLEFGLSVTEYQTYMDTKASEALASREAALVSELNAASSEADAFSSASSSAISAAESASSAATAAAHRAACELALNSVGWQDTIPVSMDLELNETHNGCMILVDCSLGPVQITLPPISNLNLDFPFSIGIKKSDASGNSVTVIRDNTDEIDGGTTKTIGASGSGAVFIPDEDPSPNLWTTAEFGATAGNMTVDEFSGDGVETDFVLSVDPGSKNNTSVRINGVYQHKNTYVLSGVSISFSEAPFDGAEIEVTTGTTLPTGVPTDATVTLSKLAQEVLNSLVPVGTKIESVRQDTPPGWVSGMNKSLGKTTGDYVGSSFFELYSHLWSMAGLSVTVGDPFRISSAKGASALADWDSGKLITIDFETNEIFTRAKSAVRNLGSYQDSENKAHVHDNGVWTYTVNNYQKYGHVGAAENRLVSAGTNTAHQSGYTSSSGSTESRPKNTALNIFFKY